MQMRNRPRAQNHPFLPQQHEGSYSDGLTVPEGTDFMHYDKVTWTAGFYDITNKPLVEICGAPFVRPRVTRGFATYQSLQGLSTVLGSEARSVQVKAIEEGRVMKDEELKNYTILSHLAEVAGDLSAKFPKDQPNGGSQ